MTKLRSEGDIFLTCTHPRLLPCKLVFYYYKIAPLKFNAVWPFCDFINGVLIQ
jgi:hypothetical protein